MPQPGRLTADHLPVLTSTSGAPAAPWQLAGALVQMITFEVDVDAALDLLPSLVARPAPPYARVMVTSYPDSPVGPYCEAQLLLSCRYRMLPRQYLAGSIVNSEAARVAAAANWQYASDLGDVSLVREGEGFVAVIGRGPLRIRVVSAAPAVTSPAVIRYDPTVVYRPAGDGTALFTVSAEPAAVHEAWLAPSSTITYESGDRADPWMRLRSKNPITATVAREDRLLPEPKEA